MEERIERLIEVVRQQTVLYDTTDKGYQNLQYKRKIWDQVAAETGFRTGTEAKTRWEKLRHSMRDAMRRRHSSSREWKYLPQMAFLHPYMQRTKRVDFAVEAEEISFEESDMKHEYSQEQQENSLGETDNSPDYLNNAAEASVSLSKNIKLENSPVVYIKPNETSDPLSSTQSPPGDPLQHFFLAMYGTTKKMPPAAQHAIKTQIFKIVSDAEGSLLSNTQPESQDGKLISYINGFAES